MSRASARQAWMDREENYDLMIQRRARLRARVLADTQALNKLARIVERYEELGELPDLETQAKCQRLQVFASMRFDYLMILTEGISKQRNDRLRSKRRRPKPTFCKSE